MLSNEQKHLLASLGMPQSFDGLNDDTLIYIEERLSEELQHHGINAERNGLNDYGELCLSIIEDIPDD